VTLALAQSRIASVGGVWREPYLALGCVAGLGAFWLLLAAGQLNLLCALMIGSILILVLLRDKASAALLTLAYLHVLGDVRRLADLTTGLPELDLLLLVGPGMAVLLALPILLRLQIKDALSKAMLLLTLLMAVEVLNPAQGGLAVGLSGALFYLVPVLWFWIGRRLASPVVVERLLYWVLFPLAVCAALLGFWQTLVGFFPYEQAWIDVTLKNYTALSLGGTTRAFGFSVSAAEYATLLEVAAAGVAAAFFTRKRLWALAFPLLVAAMLLASGRSVVVKLILALAVIWVLRKQRPLTTLGMLKLGSVALASLIGLSYLATMWVPQGGTSIKASATQESIAHLSGGLAHPFDERYSTVGIHQGMFIRGIGSSLTSPLGHGLGSTTGASSKFSESSDQFGSEIDISDMFIILGPVGGLLFIVIVVLTFRSALTYVRQTKLHVGLPVVAILTATVGSWLISGQYSTSALICFLIGALNYPQSGSAPAANQDQPSARVKPHARLPLAA
jgi:hypothetical protein